MPTWKNADFIKPSFVKATGSSKRVIILVGGAEPWFARWDIIENHWIDDYGREFSNNEVLYWIDPDMVLPYIPMLKGESSDDQ